MWNRTNSEPEPVTERGKPAPPAATRTEVRSTPATETTAEARPKPKAGQPAVIGPSITIKGDLSGEEDLLIEGRVEGEVVLKQHRIVIGSGGRLKANIQGQKIHVDGEVEGNLLGEQEVVIRKAGRVTGNITAPRVTLEDGCKFRGNVDMNPRPGRAAQAGSAAQAGTGKSAAAAAK